MKSMRVIVLKRERSIIATLRSVHSDNAGRIGFMAGSISI